MNWGTGQMYTDVVRDMNILTLLYCIKENVLVTSDKYVGLFVTTPS